MERVREKKRWRKQAKWRQREEKKRRDYPLLSPHESSAIGS
jgi:hypothetical protein